MHQSVSAAMNGLPGGVALVTIPLVAVSWQFGGPMVSDEAVYVTVARGALEGLVPYRDLFDHKPPLLYALYVIGLIGDHDGIRVLAAILWGGGALAVRSAGRAVGAGAISSWLGAALFALAFQSAEMGWGVTADALMVPFIAASFALVLRGTRDGSRWFLAAGVAGAVAILIKPVAVGSLAALLACLALDRQWAACVRVAGSALLVAVVTGLPFVALGAMDDLLYANVTFNQSYAALLDTSTRLDVFVTRTFVAFPLTAGPLALALFWLRGRLLLPWAAGCAFGLLLGGRFYPSHYLILLSPAAVGFALFATRLGEYRPLSRRAVSALMSASFVIAVWLAAAIAVADDRHALRSPAQDDRHAQAVELARVVERLTDPDDRVYVHGVDHSVYPASGRMPAVRDFWLGATAIDSRRWTAYVSQLEAGRPTLIVDSIAPDDRFGSGWLPPQDFYTLLEQRYELVQRVAGSRVYRLKQLPQ